MESYAKPEHACSLLASSEYHSLQRHEVVNHAKIGTVLLDIVNQDGIQMEALFDPAVPSVKYILVL